MIRVYDGRWQGDRNARARGRFQRGSDICKGEMPVLFPRLRAAKNFVERSVRTTLHGLYVRQRLRRAGLDGQTLEPIGFTTAAGLLAERTLSENQRRKAESSRREEAAEPVDNLSCQDRGLSVTPDD